MPFQHFDELRKVIWPGAPSVKMFATCAILQLFKITTRRSLTYFTWEYSANPQVDHRRLTVGGTDVTWIICAFVTCAGIIAWNSEVEESCCLAPHLPNYNSLLARCYRRWFTHSYAIRNKMNIASLTRLILDSWDTQTTFSLWSHPLFSNTSSVSML